MTRDHSERVNDLFAAGMRDCTPASARPMATVLFAPASHDPETADHCAFVLSGSERRKAESFLTRDLKAHFRQQRAFRRYCGALAASSTLPLSQIEFQTTEKGRPHLAELPGCWFSFSSCRLGFLGAWSSTHSIGVDIEDQARSLEATKLAQKYFSQAEAKAVEGAGHRACMRTFFQLWTLKEAALKSIGEGLPFGLDAFQFDLTSGLRVVDTPLAYGGAARFRAYAIEIAGCCAALAVRSNAGCPADSSRATPPLALTSAPQARG
jgi:phosphopantetheinyl transferase